MASYFVTRGDPDHGGDAVKSGEAEGLDQAEKTTDVKTCERRKPSKKEQRTMQETDIQQLLAQKVEAAKIRERKEKAKGCCDGRMDNLRETHHNSAWKTTGHIPQPGQRGDPGDFFTDLKNVGSQHSVAGISGYIPPLVQLPQRALAYLEQHHLLYLFEEILVEMLVRRPAKPQDYLLRWLKKIRGPIANQSIVSESESTPTLCSSCCSVGKKPVKEEEELELCGCQYPLEDLRTEQEKKKARPKSRPLVDKQEWLWKEEEKGEAKREHGEKGEEIEGEEDIEGGGAGGGGEVSKEGSSAKQEEPGGDMLRQQERSGGDNQGAGGEDHQETSKKGSVGDDHLVEQNLEEAKPREAAHDMGGGKAGESEGGHAEGDGGAGGAGGAGVAGGEGVEEITEDPPKAEEIKESVKEATEVKEEASAEEEAGEEAAAPDAAADTAAESAEAADSSPAEVEES